MKLKKSKRAIKCIVVHCTATPEGREHTAQDIDRWHKQRGWRGIGYNYVIRLDGMVEVGRDVDEIPAHVVGYNKSSIGVVYIGGNEANKTLVNGKMIYKAKDTRTQRQKESLIYLLKELKKLYPTAQILGHRDFKGVNKACPSFDAKEEYKNI
ncbi:N-acetylmuramoyl-L-alanine amidase [Capnocytophaga cynodegmi]|uniref:N-acetylmuramoyl-L-alanine amidase n=1 Tax=Capnocytophaga cynodegmi TaxID=28189 RepID=UPI001EE1D932|nr:N-acetylmuramoyl-L-alanine amidase [Capnocytophaga cynodegmi]GJQ07512.1 N-acetylmuramoyl-L-alanine amidase [Capnocytophaga cynodegmi]